MVFKEITCSGGGGPLCAECSAGGGAECNGCGGPLYNNIV